jgi:hypothetical protein
VQPSTRKRWLSEPLLHFLLAGLALFLVHRALNPTAANPDASSRITPTIDRPKLTPEDEKRLMQAQRNNRVSE